MDKMKILHMMVRWLKKMQHCTWLSVSIALIEMSDEETAKLHNAIEVLDNFIEGI